MACRNKAKKNYFIYECRSMYNTHNQGDEKNECTAKPISINHPIHPFTTTYNNNSNNVTLWERKIGVWVKEGWGRFIWRTHGEVAASSERWKMVEICYVKCETKKMRIAKAKLGRAEKMKLVHLIAWLH